MKKIILLVSFIATASSLDTQACDKCYIYNSPNLEILSTKAIYNQDLKELVLSMKVKGKAGATTPDSLGQINGAGILSYLFTTDLKAEDIGFGKTEGIVALALTSHPDFDFSPLWDENNNGVYNDDGRSWQSHWIILVKEARVGGGYAVKELNKEDQTIKFPKTAASNVPIYMDSPGFQVVIKDHMIKVIIPSYRINNKIDFKFNAMTCYMTYNVSDPNLPMLGIRNIYYTASDSEKTDLPYSVKK
jgi:hypothetical protein